MHLFHHQRKPPHSCTEYGSRIYFEHLCIFASLHDACMNEPLECSAKKKSWTDVDYSLPERLPYRPRRFRRRHGSVYGLTLRFYMYGVLPITMTLIVKRNETRYIGKLFQ